MPGNITLTGTDTVTFVGTPGHNCIFNGNNFQFLGATNGAVKFQYVTFQNAGTSTHWAIDVTLGSSNVFTLENSTWSDVYPSGPVRVTFNGTSGASVKNNTVLDTLAPIGFSGAGDAVNDYWSRFPGGIYDVGRLPWFRALGTSTTTKVFSGNRGYKSYVDTSANPNWQIGGTTCADTNGNIDANANYFIGYISGFSLGANTTFIGNFSHVIEDVWNDPVAYSPGEVPNINGPSSGTACDNIVISGQWQWRGLGSTETKNNVVLFHDGHFNLEMGGSGDIHHNLFGQAFQGLDSYNDITTTLRWAEESVPATGTGGSFYNNTLDSSNYVNGSGVMLAIASGTTLVNVKNNLFWGLKLGTGTAMIAPLEGGASCPNRVSGTFDYNFFHYRSGSVANYQICKTASPPCSNGIGAHDPGGCGNDSGSNGPQGTTGGHMPIGFPFDDRDIKSGTVTLSQMLTYYRSVYAPGASSPAHNAGDDSLNIGAVATTPAQISVNLHPSVKPSPTLAVTIGDIVPLGGFCGDDGLPSGTLTTSYSKVSGPGTFTYMAAGNNLNTATFSVAGKYVIRMTCDDGSLTNTADFEVFVYAARANKILLSTDVVTKIQADVAGSAAWWTTLLSGSPFGGQVNLNTQVNRVFPSITISTCTNAATMNCTAAGALPFATTANLYFGDAGAGWTSLNNTSSSGYVCTNVGSNHFTCPVDSSGFGAFLQLSVWDRDGMDPNTYFSYDYQGFNWYYSLLDLGIAYVGTGTTSYCTAGKRLLDGINTVFSHGIPAPMYIDSGYAARAVANGIAFFYAACYSQLGGIGVRTGTVQMTGATMNYIQSLYLWSSAINIAASGTAPIRETNNVPWSNYYSGWVKGAALSQAVATEFWNGQTAVDYWINETNTAFANALAAPVARTSYADELSGTFQGSLYGGYPQEGWSYGQGTLEGYLYYMRTRYTASGGNDDPSATYPLGVRAATTIVHDLLPDKWGGTRDGEFQDEAGIAPQDLAVTLSGVLCYPSCSTQAKWMEYEYQNKASSPSSTTLNNIAEETAAIFYDSTRTATAWSGTEPTYRFDGGWRWNWISDWTYNGSTIWASFQTRQWNASDHEARNAGQMEINRGSDRLLIPAYEWKGTSATGYSGSSPQNRIDTNDYASTFFLNDSGQTGAYCNYPTTGCQDFRGWNVLALHKETTNYSYALADLTSAYAILPGGASYSSRSLRYFYRTWVAMGDGTFFAFDRAKVTNAAFVKQLRWSLNPFTTPTRSGCNYTSTVGSSSLFLTTLNTVTPTCDLVQIVAGSDGTTPYTYAARYAEAGTDFNPITVFYTTSSVGSNPATTTLSTIDANFVGVQVADTTPKVLILAKTVTPSGDAYTLPTYASTSFTTTHAGTGHYLVAGLNTGNYAATGPATTSCTVGADGTCYFTGPSGAWALSQTCTITPSTLPSGTVGVSYGTQTLTASNCGGGTLTWTLTAGALPTGLSGCNSITGATCNITGTPTTTTGSPFTPTIHVTDGGSNSASQAYSITISSGGGGPAITITSPTNGSVLQAVNLTNGRQLAITSTVTEGSGNKTWRVCATGNQHVINPQNCSYGAPWTIYGYPGLPADGAVDYVVTSYDIFGNVLATSATVTATTRLTGLANSISTTGTSGSITVSSNNWNGINLGGGCGGALLVDGFAIPSGSSPYATSTSCSTVGLDYNGFDTTRWRNGKHELFMDLTANPFGGVLADPYLPGNTFTSGSIAGSPSTVTLTQPMFLVTNRPIWFTTTGTLPTPLVSGAFWGTYTSMTSPTNLIVSDACPSGACVATLNASPGVSIGAVVDVRNFVFNNAEAAACEGSFIVTGASGNTFNYTAPGCNGTATIGGFNAPGSLSIVTNAYYAIWLTGTTIQVATTPNGSAINLGAGSTGTHTVAGRVSNGYWMTDVGNDGWNGTTSAFARTVVDFENGHTAMEYRPAYTEINGIVGNTGPTLCGTVVYTDDTSPTAPPCSAVTYTVVDDGGVSGAVTVNATTGVPTFVKAGWAKITNAYSTFPTSTTYVHIFAATITQPTFTHDGHVATSYTAGQSFIPVSWWNLDLSKLTPEGVGALADRPAYWAPLMRDSAINTSFNASNSMGTNQINPVFGPGVSCPTLPVAGDSDLDAILTTWNFYQEIDLTPFYSPAIGPGSFINNTGATRQVCVQNAVANRKATGRVVRFSGQDEVTLNTGNNSPNCTGLLGTLCYTNITVSAGTATIHGQFSITEAVWNQANGTGASVLIKGATNTCLNGWQYITGKTVVGNFVTAATFATGCGNGTYDQTTDAALNIQYLGIIPVNTVGAPFWVHACQLPQYVAGGFVPPYAYQGWTQVSDGQGNTTSNATLVSITGNGTIATVVLTGHGLTNGQSIAIQGAATAAINGLHVVTVTGANGFTFPYTGATVTSGSDPNLLVSSDCNLPSNYYAQLKTIFQVGGAIAWQNTIKGAEYADPKIISNWYGPTVSDTIMTYHPQAASSSYGEDAPVYASQLAAQNYYLNTRAYQPALRADLNGTDMEFIKRHTGYLFNPALDNPQTGQFNWRPENQVANIMSGATFGIVGWRNAWFRSQLAAQFATPLGARNGLNAFAPEDSGRAWGATARAYQAVQHLDRYLLQPHTTSPGLGLFYNTLQTTSTYGNMLMAVCLLDGGTTDPRTVDLTGIRQAGGSIYRMSLSGYRLRFDVLAGNPTSDTYTMCGAGAGETVAYIAQPSGATSDLTPTTFAAPGTIPYGYTKYGVRVGYYPRDMNDDPVTDCTAGCTINLMRTGGPVWFQNIYSKDATWNPITSVVGDATMLVGQ